MLSGNAETQMYETQSIKTFRITFSNHTGGSEEEEEHEPHS